MRRTTKGLILAMSVVATTVPSPAHAEEERKSPLADAPAIRKRFELRDKRFEIGVGGGSSLGNDFYHAVTVNGRLGFHLTDWLALGGVFAHNLTPTMKTSFNEELLDSLQTSTKDRTPTRAQAEAGMNRIAQVIALQAELVPFTGKFGLFSKLFMNYDFYAFGGPGFVNFQADEACDTDNKPSCAVTGFKIGANFGVGLHAFFNDYFAINAELRDVLVRNNPAGRDENGDGFANDHDLAWDSNYMVTVNLMFFLPTKADVSN